MLKGKARLTPIEPMTLNRAASVRLQSFTKPKRRECYSNSVKALGYALTRAGMDASKARYAEGYVITLGIPIAHGWLTYDGKAIETTIPVDGGEILTYFPAYQLTGREVVNGLQESDRMLPLFAHLGYEFGRGNPDRARCFAVAQFSSMIYGVSDEQRPTLQAMFENVMSSWGFRA